MAQKVGSAGASYHLLDTHSDVVGLVSTAAANQGTTSYDAYGGVLGTTGTQGILGYQGDITDAATKQVDMGTRWYAPGQGRFTSRDVLFGELSSPMTLNQFAYAGENPITMWDPTGMMQAGAEGGGYCGKWCEAAQYGYCESQGVACGSNHYGGSGYQYSPAPPPPPPAPPITHIREAEGYSTRGVDISDALGGISDALIAARRNVSAAGAALRSGSSWGGTTVRRWGASTRWMGGKVIRGAGGVLMLVGFGLDFRAFQGQGDSAPVAAIKGAAIAAGTWGGAAAGAAWAGGACAASGLLTEVSPLCAAAGGLAGGLTGGEIVRRNIAPDYFVSTEHPLYPLPAPPPVSFGCTELMCVV